jgi:hypothetical protein
MKSSCLTVLRRLILAGAFGLAGVLAACGPAQPVPALNAPSPELGYLQAPVLSSARLVGGQVVLSGRAASGARVRLSSPKGQAFGTTVSDAGQWTIEVPIAANAADPLRLFGLSQDRDGRMVQAEGYVAVLPDATMPAVLLRAGTGARQIHAAQANSAPILIADFDDLGGLAVSGSAMPSQAIKAALDGDWIAQGFAGRDGRYSLALSGSIRPGPHQVLVQVGGRTLAITIDIQPARLPGGTLYKSIRLQNGWRIDWTTPSGGVQSSVIMNATTQGPP